MAAGIDVPDDEDGREFPITLDAELPPEAAPREKPAARFVRFDPYRRCASPSLQDRVSAFGHHLETQENRERRRRANDRESFMLAVEALCANFLVNAMVAPRLDLAVPRSNGVMHSSHPDASPVYGDHFVKLIDLMAGLKLVEQTRRGFNFHTRGGKQPTTLRILPGLCEHLPVGNTVWADFGRDHRPRALILKSRKHKAGGEDFEAREDGGKPIPFEHTDETRRMKGEVRDLNALLLEADFTLDHAAVSKPVDEHGHVVDPTERQVYRVFNNGLWTHGGRLYGGFWETVEKSDRFAALRIQGERVANVDFKNLFARLAYAKVHVEPPEEDLYLIDGIAAHREAWKTLVNAMLFSQGDLRHWPRGVGQVLSRRGSLASALEAVKRKHPAIADQFGIEAGMEFMKTESDILMSVLPALYAKGIVALPLHDSVLTARSKAKDAKHLMEEAYCRATGQSRAFVEVTESARGKT